MSIGSRFPPYTTVPCKIRNVAKKGKSFPELLIILLFADVSRKSSFYDMQAIHGKMSMEPKIAKSNCFYVARPLHNINIVYNSCSVS